MKATLDEVLARQPESDLTASLSAEQVADFREQSSGPNRYANEWQLPLAPLATPASRPWIDDGTGLGPAREIAPDPTARRLIA